MFDFRMISRIGSRLSEHGGSERKFDRSSETLVVPGLQHLLPPLLPLSGQSARVPLVLIRNRGEQGD